MTTTKEAAKKRTAILAELRKQNEDKVKIAQALLKEQRAARKTLKKVMEGKSMTVPEIAEATGMPSHEVLWHVTAMKKYGEVVEDGTDDDFEYFLYRLAKEA